MAVYASIVKKNQRLRMNVMAGFIDLEKLTTRLNILGSEIFE